MQCTKHLQVDKASLKVLRYDTIRYDVFNERKTFMGQEGSKRPLTHAHSTYHSKQSCTIPN